MLALATMDPVVQGILFLVAVVLFLLAAFWGTERPYHWTLVPLGLAFFAFVFMWNAFAAA